MKFSYRAALTSLALGFTAMVGLNAQAVETTTTQDDTFTCIVNGFVACFSSGGSQSDMETCMEDVFTTCLGDVGG